MHFKTSLWINDRGHLGHVLAGGLRIGPQKVVVVSEIWFHKIRKGFEHDRTLI